MKIAARTGSQTGTGWVGRRRWLHFGIRWLVLTGVAITLTALELAAIMRPSTSDLMQMALFLVASGVISLALGQGALWLADARGVGSVRLRLLLPSVLATLVIAFNVILVAWKMFIAAEDAQIVLGFLAFGVALALVLSLGIASEMGRAIARVEMGARRIAEGDFGYRIGEATAGGTEELARLARWFNQMAQSVQSAFAQRQAAEVERRQLVAAISHDLRTPLASVRAMIEAIDDGVVSDQETVRRYLHTMHAEVRRLSALVDDFFELSRVESGALILHPERLALDDLLSDAMEAARSQAERNEVRLVGHIAGALPVVEVDARQISRALSNLLQNALRYTTPDDVILLYSTTFADHTGRPWIRVTVADSGPGIPASSLPHVFERTFRGETSRARSHPHAERAGSVDEDGIPGGAGLGLTITRGVIEAHGGTIEACSPLTADLHARIAPYRAAPDVPFQGTALTFALPALPREEVG